MNYYYYFFAPYRGIFTNLLFAIFVIVVTVTTIIIITYLLHIY